MFIVGLLVFVCIAVWLIAVELEYREKHPVGEASSHEKNN